jgi:hypothetical protein
VAFKGVWARALGGWVVDASVSALLAHTSSIHEREQAGADVEVGRHAWALCEWWQRRGSGSRAWLT